MQDFATFGMLMTKHGDSDANPLRSDFAALCRAIPTIGIIDMNYEDDYHQPTMVAFSRMLFDLEFRITFCPYKDVDFWRSCSKELYATNWSIVSVWCLQYYAGETSNASRENVKRWVDAVIMVTGMSRREAAAFVRLGHWCFTSIRTNLQVRHQYISLLVFKIEKISNCVVHG